MYTDWAIKFKVNRPIENADRRKLDRVISIAKKSDERLSLSAFNSTYVEFVDRRFRLRGGLLTTFAVAFTFFLLISLEAILNKYIEKPGKMTIVHVIVAAFALLSACYFFYWIALRQDFFNYTHRPIRFNRRTRKVYVFREGGSKRIISMPWEEGYFHIGEGLRQKFLLDLRCHILEGNIIKDTFAIGHYFDREEPILEMWEFIRRYMEEGPEAVKPPFIGLSVEPTLKNCYIWVTASMGLASPVMRVILFPLVAISVLTRYLALKSSRRPKFPSEIEDECIVDSDDPHALPSPPYISSGYNDDAAFKKAMEKHAARKR